MRRASLGEEVLRKGGRRREETTYGQIKRHTTPCLTNPGPTTDDPLGATVCTSLCAAVAAICQVGSQPRIVHPSRMTPCRSQTKMGGG